MAKLWFISDTHFAHDNIYKFTYVDKYGVERRVRERFASMEEGDAYMYQRWAELVKPADHVWHLGDVTMQRSSAAKGWFVNRIRSLPGHKRLVLGNHDQFTMDVYRDAGFEKIRGSHRIDNILFTHYPVVLATEAPKNKVVVNVHGHIHQNDPPTQRHINISVERTGYEPVPMDWLVEEVNRRVV